MTEVPVPEVETEESGALVRRPAPLMTVGRANAAMLPTSLGEAMALAEMLAKSNIVPKEFRERPGDVLVAVLQGLELGLHPVQALQSIAVLNGRAVVWGDAVLALVIASGKLAEHKEEFHKEGSDPEKFRASCRVRREGDEEAIERTFSWADAQRAKVWENGKLTSLAERQTYQSYPRRMLQMRARAWALRDKFPDVLKGVAIREEVEDYGDGDREPTGHPADDMMPRAKNGGHQDSPLQEAVGTATREPLAGDAPKAPAGEVVDTTRPPISDEDAMLGAMVGEDVTPRDNLPAGQPTLPGTPEPEEDEELTRDMLLERIDRFVGDRKVKADLFARLWTKHVGADRDQAPPAKLRALMDELTRTCGGAASATPAAAKPGAGKVIGTGSLPVILGSTTFMTHGITKEQLLQTFALCEAVDKKAKTTLHKTILKREFGLEHRHDLTHEQALAYMAKLRETIGP